MPHYVSTQYCPNCWVMVSSKKTSSLCGSHQNFANVYTVANSLYAFETALQDILLIE